MEAMCISWKCFRFKKTLKPFSPLGDEPSCTASSLERPEHISVCGRGHFTGWHMHCPSFFFLKKTNIHLFSVYAQSWQDVSVGKALGGRV